MEDRETLRMHQYGESKTTRIMMATAPHVTSGSGLRKFQADGFLLDRVYTPPVQRSAWRWPYNWAETCRWKYNLIYLIKYKVVYDYTYIYNILAYSTRRGCLTWKREDKLLLRSRFWRKYYTNKKWKHIVKNGEFIYLFIYLPWKSLP